MDTDDVTVMYHSAVDSRGFSPQFCAKYAELSGGVRPEPWAQDEIRIDNSTSMRVVEEIGVENCGRGLTVALVSRRHLPALRLMDCDGCEYPDLDPHRFVMHYVRKHLETQPSITRQEFEKLVEESRQLRLRIISRASLSPVNTSNRYSCLSD